MPKRVERAVPLRVRRSQDDDASRRGGDHRPAPSLDAEPRLFAKPPSAVTGARVWTGDEHNITNAGTAGSPAERCDG